MTSDLVEPAEMSVNGHLQELILDSGQVGDFLDGLSRFAARSLSASGDEVLCGVTLLRPKGRAATVASSTDQAKGIDEIQYGFGDGPCMTASREQRTVLVDDLREEQRWPEYAETVLNEGMRSILAVPFDLEEDAKAAMNLYSHRTGRFDADTIALAEDFARQASSALRLAVRLAIGSDTAADLKAALESRTVIDLAVGIVMGQNRCSQSAAFEILKSASSTRNIKLREVASALVDSLGQGPASTHFIGG